MVAKKRTRKNVAEGVKFLRSANGQFAGSVGSGEKPKKPRKPKAKAVVGKLDSRQKERLAKTLKEKYTVEQLKKKKVSELKDIALGLGATEPSKYKNRKDSWIAEINKVYDKEPVKSKKKKTPKPKVDKPKIKDMFGYTGDELSKMKVDELEVLAEKVGAVTPTKYKNRRQSWLDVLEKASNNSEFKPDDKPLVIKDQNYFLRKGREFTDQYLVSNEPGVRELAYIERKKELGEAIQKAIANKQVKKLKQLTEEFHVTEERLQEQVQMRLSQSSHDNVLNNILGRSKLTREQAIKLAESVEIDELDVPEDDAKVLRTMVADFHQLTGGRVKTLKRIEYSRPRAYADENGVINIGKNIEYAYTEKLALRATLYHEMGHHVEFSAKELVGVAQQWRNGRAESDELELLSVLTGNSNYGDNEKAYKDAFYSHYVGKHYEDGYTEVLSMGLEKFAHPQTMRNLYEDDSDHYHLIVGILIDDN